MMYQCLLKNDGRKLMPNRILITYATRAGSTVEVAAAIGNVLARRGFSVDVKPVKEKPSVEGYQALVVGSAICMGSWLPEAVNFVKDNQAQLSRIPTTFFTVHMLNRGEDETSRQARQAYTAAVRQVLRPVDEAFFSGKMDYSRLSFLDRTIAKAVEKQTDSRPGDFRDWVIIRSWANELYLDLESVIA
jgi:menaquinone-dependent protoporphyrinogen oxidase